MKRTCLSCGTRLPEGVASRFVVTGRVCAGCAATVKTEGGRAAAERLVEAIDAPVLLMQSEPKRVYAANAKALRLFGKERQDVEGRRGGDVFDCLHSFSAAGCGKDRHCDPCRIRQAVVEALHAGQSSSGVTNPLQVKREEGFSTFHVQVSAERVGELALLRIDRFEKA